MSYEAIFIGGAFDMTKQKLTNKRERVFFYEPAELRHEYMIKENQEMVPCKKLSYRLNGETRRGVLVYEIEALDYIKHLDKAQGEV